MKNIDWKSKTTLRALAWAWLTVIGTIGYFIGKDITPIILLSSGVASAFGFKPKE
jgi:hypothetical protein